MSRYGKLVSPIKMIPISCKSPLLKHVVFFRRFLYMIVKGDEELDLSLHIKVDDSDYVIFATTERMKCFNCGEVGHLIRFWPSKTTDNRSVVVDTVGVGNADGSAVSGPSNAAAVVSGTAEARAVVSPPAFEGAAIQVSVPEIANNGKELINVDTQSHMSCVRLDGQAGVNTANVLMSDLIGGDDIEMEVRQTDFKIPPKRKMDSVAQMGKAKKAGVEVVHHDDGDIESGSESSVSQSYDAEDIRLFLKTTKNKRGVRVSVYFPDTKQFVDKSRCFMSEGLFTNKEIFRLKNIVQKRTPGNSDEGSGKI